MKDSKRNKSNKGSSHKIIVWTLLIVIVLAGGCIVYKGFFVNKIGNADVLNVEAEKNKEKRYLTIINETNQIINEVYVYYGDGEEAETMQVHEPERDSFSIEIPEELVEYDKFTVTMIDRYGYKYEKTVRDVGSKGRTNVKISEENKVKQKGDFFRGIEQFFNND